MYFDYIGDPADASNVKSKVQGYSCCAHIWSHPVLCQVRVWNCKPTVIEIIIVSSSNLELGS